MINLIKKGKTAIALLLLLSLALSFVPSSIIVARAEEEAISFSDMEIGVVYNAKFDYSKYQDMYLYGDGQGSTMYSSTELKNDFPQELMVVRQSSPDRFVYVTNENWPAKYAEYRYLDPAELIILSNGASDTPETPDDGYVRGEIGLIVDGETVSQIAIGYGEKTHVFTKLSENVGENATYQWQLRDPSGEWINIADYIMPYAAITVALIKNALDAEEKAYLRCLVTESYVTYASEVITVTIAPDSDYVFVSMYRMYQMMAESGDEDEGDGEGSGLIEAFQITIVYQFLHENPSNPEHNGSTAANTFTLTFGSGDEYTGDIISPPIPGYKPYREVMEGETVKETDVTIYGGKRLVPADTYHFQNQRDKILVTIYYVPQTVYYRVKYFKQNLSDDGYTDWKTEYREGIADTEVGDTLAPPEVGFEALAYDKEAIVTNDGMAVVEIYYDRIYYLVKYELDGGYGVMPSYVRYGTTVTLGSPTNPGYSFDEWTLTSVKNSVDGEELPLGNFPQYKVTAAYAQINIAHNLIYRASWNVADTSYTIIYWLEDPSYDDATGDPKKKYQIWGTEKITGAKSGDVVDGPASGEVPESLYLTRNAVVKAEGNKTVDVDLRDYLDFIESDQDVLVKGDGSTVVNVYYDRKEYTLKFYYARKSGDTWAVCGRTNQFGNEAKVSDKDKTDEAKLLSGMPNTDFGAVVSQPTFKTDTTVDTDKYTLSSDTYNNIQYYYLSFKAKYGENIADLYPCDVFNPVARSGKSGNAVMSAWTGEYNVIFSAIGGNQTLKGKFEIFDYRMLWHKSKATDWNSANNPNKSGIVTYLCFWENAYDSDTWDVPELYRYKIWVPLPAGETAPDGVQTLERTETVDGKATKVTYYLHDVYDTCDNSAVGEQTQPTLKGFTANGESSIGNIYANNFKRPAELTQAEYNEITAQEMKNVYNEAWIVNYFYSRNSYKLILLDEYLYDKEINVPYQTDLNQYKTEVPIYPTTKEQNAIAFAGDGNGTGWYLDQSFTLSFSFDQKMDANNIQIYAKWNPTEWSIKVYLDEAQTILLYDDTVDFGDLIPEPAYKTEQQKHPAYAELIFAGWYYTDGNGNDVRFDFNTMPIKQNYVIFAKWTSTVPIGYTVRYVISDGNGGYIDIAEPSTGVSLVGVTKSFVPKVGDALYEEYRKEKLYLPVARSISKEMTNVSEDNVVYFEYKTIATIEYTIKHVFNSEKFVNIVGTDTYELKWSHWLSGDLGSLSGTLEVRFDADLEAKVKAQPKGSELWKVIVNLSPDEYRHELILVADEDEHLDLNGIVFNWEDRGTTFMYQEVHYFPTVDGSGYTARYKSCIGTYDAQDKATVSATHETDIQGFVAAKDNDGKPLTKNYKKTDTGERVIELYYERVTYNYIVEYRYGNMQIATRVNGTAKYQQKVTHEAKTITGYIVDGSASQTVEITFEGQIITFYYVAKTVILSYSIVGGEGGKVSNPQEVVNINEVAKGSSPTAFPGYIFDGWYTDPQGENKVSAAWVDANGKLTPLTTVDDADKAITYYAKFVPTKLTITNRASVDTPVEGNQSFIYAIKGNGITLRVAVLGTAGSQTVYGLPLGTYTVEIENAWSWNWSSGNDASVSVDVEGDYHSTIFYYSETGDSCVTDSAYYPSKNN